MQRKRVPTGSYEVGYAKTPQHTRFKPGQSGNRRGRPKGVPHFTLDLSRMLNQRIVVKENGRRRVITKGEAILTQLVNTAASGNVRTMALYLKDLLDLEARLEAKAASARPRVTGEQIAAKVNRLLGLTPDDDDPAGENEGNKS